MAYYSERKHGAKPFTLDQLKRLFQSLHNRMDNARYLREYFGPDQMEQVNAVFSGTPIAPGLVGSDLGAYFLLRLHKDNLWPISDRLPKYSEDDVFDVMELLYDHISLPPEKDGSGFDRERARSNYRKDLGGMLSEYGEGYELTLDGKVVPKGEEGLREVFSANLPTDDDTIKAKVGVAIQKYRDRHSSMSDRRDAVRDLADVCEILRPQIKQSMMKKDEDGLFDIANNYAIRHYRDTQKTDYGAEWLSWFFYLYLSTIHLCLRIMNRERASQSAVGDFPEA
jgi:hypothetical protein